MTKKFLELREIDFIVAQLYRKNPALVNSKFGYAYKKFYEQNCKTIFQEFNDKALDIRITDALVDKTTKEILLDSTNSRGFKYDKEGFKKVIEAERKLEKEYNEKEIEIKPYISTYIPENLTENEIEQLTGLII